MKRRKSLGSSNASEIDALVERIIVDSHGDGEQLWAFRQVLDDELDLPIDAHVISEPISLAAVEFDGNMRRGSTARCVREDGSEHTVAACDVRVPEGSRAAPLLAAYRRWVGLDSEARGRAPGARPPRPHKVTEDDLGLSHPVELVLLSVKESSAHCRLLGQDRVLTLRSRDVWRGAPGWIVKVRPPKALALRPPPVPVGQDRVLEARRGGPGSGSPPFRGPWDLGPGRSVPGRAGRARRRLGGRVRSLSGLRGVAP